MMEIETLKEITVSGESHGAGSFLEVTPRLAEKLIRRGYARIPEKPKPKTKPKKG